jgi:YfiH family protein
MTTLWIPPNWPAPDNVQAICTTVSFGNLATHAGDQKHVLENRLNIRKEFDLPFEPAWLNQTHSNHVVNIQKPIHEAGSVIADCDASYTALASQACVVLTADCLPLLLCDKAGQQVAAVHAGWKGLANGIIANTLSQFIQPEAVLVWLGPAMGPKVYEVGQDVVDIFLGLDLDNRQAIKKSNQSNSQDKYLIDLYQLARIQLSKLGVSHIYGGEYCTYSQPDLFYSYRRDNQTGRMASLIWKKR